MNALFAFSADSWPDQAQKLRQVLDWWEHSERRHKVRRHLQQSLEVGHDAVLFGGIIDDISFKDPG